MTAEEAFTVRELHRDGLLPWRIAELLDLDEAEVLRVLNGGSVQAPAPAPVVEEPLKRQRRKRDPGEWPAPVDFATTVWSAVRPVQPGTSREAAAVQVRQVMLWGKRVLINAANEVWCPACHTFRATGELSRPGNGCPVGLLRTGVIREVDASVDDEPRYRPVSTSEPVNFMQVQW